MINTQIPQNVIRPSGLGYLEVTDMFCGAGGSSLGLEYVPGLVVTQCINHDKLAIEAHNFNFPNADHDQQDIWETPARRFRRTPILWASPSCTHHAFCRGEKSDTEDADKSRATMWCVNRFTEHHKYDAVIVENVVEARLWCENHTSKVRDKKTGKMKVKGCNCGSTFSEWYGKMIALGYEGQTVYFNSQFALPTPQSRDRMYVVFWRKGARRPNLDFRPTSWCSTCEKVVNGMQTWKKTSKGTLRSKPGMYEWGRYGSQYTYNCPECTNAVAPAVVGSKSAIDFSNPGELIGNRKKPLADKTRKRIKVGLERLITTRPVTVQVGGNLYERKGYARVWSVDAPFRTLTTTNYTALVCPAGSQEAMAKEADVPMHALTTSDRLAMVVAGKSDTVPSSVEEPTGSVTARTHLGFVVRAGGQSPAPKTSDEPMMSITAHDRQIAAVIPNMEHNVGRSTDEPMRPVTTGGNHMLVQVSRGAGTDASEASRSRSVEEPMTTVTGAHRGELAIVALRNHGDVKSGDEPAPTVVGGGNHHGMLVYNGVPGHARFFDGPTGVVTGRDHHSLVMPYYGSGGLAKVTDQPMGALTSKDRHALVITEDDIDDCYFRMLKWPELLRAQHMHIKADGTPYLLEAQRKNARGKYVGLSDELRVRYIGNAVSSTVAAMVGGAVAEALV